MAADGLSVRSPEDIVGRPVRFPDEDDPDGERIDPYWMGTYQWVKSIDEHPLVKRARARHEKKRQKREETKTGKKKRPGGPPSR